LESSQSQNDLRNSSLYIAVAVPKSVSLLFAQYSICLPKLAFCSTAIVSATILDAPFTLLFITNLSACTSRSPPIFPFNNISPPLEVNFPFTFPSMIIDPPFAIKSQLIVVSLAMRIVQAAKIKSSFMFPRIVTSPPAIRASSHTFPSINILPPRATRSLVTSPFI